MTSQQRLLASLLETAFNYFLNVYFQILLDSHRSCENSSEGSCVPFNPAFSNNSTFQNHSAVTFKTLQNCSRLWTLSSFAFRYLILRVSLLSLLCGFSSSSLSLNVGFTNQGSSLYNLNSHLLWPRPIALGGVYMKKFPDHYFQPWTLHWIPSFMSNCLLSLPTLASRGCLTFTCRNWAHSSPVM